MQDHEQARLVLAGHLQETAVQVRGDGAAHRAAAHRLLRRPGAVGGQFQQIGCPGQFVAPEGDLTGSEAARVVLRAEQFPLPHRVVGVLHRERRPRRFGAGRAGPVGDHDVARERRHRQSVRRHVMRNQGEHVLGGAEPPQMCPYGQLHGDVEGCGRDALEALWQLRLGDVLGLEVERRVGDRTHLLHRAVGGVRKHRAQRLVAFDYVGERAAECGNVQRAAQPDRDRDVVRGRSRGELIDEPHPLLRERDRHRSGVVARHQWRACAVARSGGLDACGEHPHGRCLEQVEDREFGPEGRIDAGHDPGRGQRVAAEIEEAVGGADPLHAEQFGEHPGDLLLVQGGRRVELAGAHVEPGFGQGPAIEFPGRGQRERIEHDDARGHHVRRQHVRGVRGDLGRQMLPDAGLPVALRLHVRHQQCVPRRSDEPGGEREPDVGVRPEGGLDLTEFDPVAADLDLEVGATHVLERVPPTEPAPAHQVTGAVHPGAVERVRHEAFGGGPRPRVVTAGQPLPVHVQLAGDTRRHRTQPSVEHQYPGADGRAADRDVLPHHQRVGHTRHDGRLRGAVRVEHPVPRRPLFHEIGRAGLAAGHHALELGQRVRVDRSQRGRGDERMGDPFVAQQRGQLGAAVDGRWCDHHGRARAEREHQFEHRCVEARRREVQRARIGPHPVAPTFVLCEVRQPAMSDGDALGGSGRP